MNLDAHRFIYVDVDGTLLFWPGKSAGRVPRLGEDGHGKPPQVNEPLADALRKWHRDGRILVLWSFGGKAHCEMAAQVAGLKPDACLPKPSAIVDDSFAWLSRLRNPVHISPNGKLRAA